MNKRATIKISGRKIEGYPTVTKIIEFENLDDFINKADAAIEEADFGKVDCYVLDEGQFSESDLQTLENNWFILE